MNYLSKYSNGKEVTAAQYITELICENKARKDKKDLHFRFWTNKEWAKYYRDQIATANKLVKKYKEQAIVAAIKHKDAEKIYSLRAPHLIAIIEREEERLSCVNNEITKTYDRSESKSYRTRSINNKAIISKLKDLE